jgi:hypothetical protein
MRRRIEIFLWWKLAGEDYLVDLSVDNSMTRKWILMGC